MSRDAGKTRRKKLSGSDELDCSIGPVDGLIAPSCDKRVYENKPHDLKRMLQIYLLQNLYNPADETTDCEIIDSLTFSESCGVASSN